jgi:hypothetical protein
MTSEAMRCATALVSRSTCGAILLFLSGICASAQSNSPTQSQSLSGYGPPASLETGDSVTEDLYLDDQRVDGSSLRGSIGKNGSTTSTDCSFSLATNPFTRR